MSDAQQQPADEVAPDPFREDRVNAEAVVARGWPIGGLVLAAAVALLVIAAVPVFKRIDSLRPTHAGVAAPTFQLKSLAGKQVALEALRGKVVLLEFWSLTCPPCLKKMPKLEKLQRDLGARGLEVLAINVDGDEAQVAAYFRKRGGARLRTLLNGRSVAGQYGVTTIPHVVLVDRQGHVKYVESGAGNVSELQNQLHLALSAGAPQGS